MLELKTFVYSWSQRHYSLVKKCLYFNPFHMKIFWSLSLSCQLEFFWLLSHSCLRKARNKDFSSSNFNMILTKINYFFFAVFFGKYKFYFKKKIHSIYKYWHYHQRCRQRFFGQNFKSLSVDSQKTRITNLRIMRSTCI